MKIVFCDLDGTVLLPKEKVLSKTATDGIKKILDNNIIFCVASGRCYSELKRIFEGFDQDIYFIPSDGSLIVYKDETLFECAVDKDSLGFLDDERDYVLHGKYISYVKSCKDTFVRKIKEQYNGHVKRILNYKEIEDDVYKLTLYNSHKEIPMENVYKDYYIREFVNSTNKGNAVKNLLEILSLDKKDAVSLGDGANDIEMFEETGEAYAMVQAPPDVKKKATGIVLGFSQFADKVVKE